MTPISTEPFDFSSQSVAAAGPANNATLRSAISPDSTVKVLLVDSSHPRIDIQNLMLLDAEAAPPAPATPGLTATGSTLTASWTAPTATPAVGSYQLEWREGSSGTVTQELSISGTSYTVYRLKAQTQYQVRVRGINSVGTGAWSPWASVTTGGTAGAVSLADRTVTAASPGVLVKGSVAPRLVTGPRVLVVQGNASVRRLTDQIPVGYIQGGGNAYWTYFDMLADGRITMWLASSATELGNTAGPQFTSTAISNLWIVLFYEGGVAAWDFRLLSDSSEPFTFSSASVSSAGTASNTALRNAIGGSSAVIAMLVDDSDPRIDIANLQLLPAPPDVPSNVALAAVDTDTVRGSWDAVAGATSYQGQYKKSSDTGWTSISGDITSPHDIDGLDSGTAYDFRVRATGTAGSSNYSAAASATTASPLAVTDFVTPAGRRNVHVGLFERSSHAAWLWRLDQNLGRLIGGSLGTFTRINYNRNTTNFQVNDTPNPPDLNVFFASGGDGFDYHIHIQDATGVASFPVDGTAVDGSGGHFFRWRTPTAFDTVAARIAAGERFILAMTEPAPAAKDLTGAPSYTGALTAPTAALTRLVKRLTGAPSYAGALTAPTAVLSKLVRSKQLTGAPSYTGALTAPTAALTRLLKQLTGTPSYTGALTASTAALTKEMRPGKQLAGAPSYTGALSVSTAALTKEAVPDKQLQGAPSYTGALTVPTAALTKETRPDKRLTGAPSYSGALTAPTASLGSIEPRVTQLTGAALYMGALSVPTAEISLARNHLTAAPSYLGAFSVPTAEIRKSLSPDPPVGVAVEPQSSSTVTVFWDPVPGATRYDLRHRVFPDDFEVVSGVASPYILGGLQSGAQHDIQVRAAVGADIGMWSDLVGGKTFAFRSSPAFLDDLSLLIGQYDQSVKLRALVGGLMSLLQDQLMDPVFYLEELHSLEQSYGVFLDYIGERLGLKRPNVPATDQRFFGFGAGTDRGTWGEVPFFSLEVALEGLAPLPDPLYRSMLRGRGLSLRLGATVPDIEAVGSVTFTGGCRVVDGLNRRVEVFCRDTRPGFVSLVAAQGILPRPAGVRMTITEER